MRIPKTLPVISIIDAVVFLSTYSIRVFDKGALLEVATVLYWASVFAGLVLAVVSFISLTTGGESQLKRSVVCALFSFLPACFGLVAVLSRLGTPVGGVHLS